MKNIKKNTKELLVPKNTLFLYIFFLFLCFALYRQDSRTEVTLTKVFVALQFKNIEKKKRTGK